jgi:hypothetical protein
MDRRRDGITAAQRRIGAWCVGAAWCGVWACNAALAGGVKMSNPSRWAGVANIEDDARAHRNGFRYWIQGRPTKHDWKRRIFRGDLIILYGRGVHVETVRDMKFDKQGRLLYVVTDGGNTGSGPGGSQSNGGGAFRRIRYPGEIYGVACVDYPG